MKIGVKTDFWEGTPEQIKQRTISIIWVMMIFHIIPLAIFAMQGEWIATGVMTLAVVFDTAIIISYNKWKKEQAEKREKEEEKEAKTCKKDKKDQKKNQQ